MEAISNPLARVTDLAGVALFARRHGLTPVVDNTFASPVLCRPANMGFVVVHSATKFLNGHSDLLAGVVSGSRDFIGKVRALPTSQACSIAGRRSFAGSPGLAGQPQLLQPSVHAVCCTRGWASLQTWLVSTGLPHLLGDGMQVSQKMVMYGGCLDPHACFLLNRGMATLGLRMRQQCASALAIAEMLQQHPMVPLTYLCSERLAPFHLLPSVTCSLCQACQTAVSITETLSHLHLETPPSSSAHHARQRTAMEGCDISLHAADALCWCAGGQGVLPSTGQLARSCPGCKAVWQSGWRGALLHGQRLHGADQILSWGDSRMAHFLLTPIMLRPEAFALCNCVHHNQEAACNHMPSHVRR